MKITKEAASRIYELSRDVYLGKLARKESLAIVTGEGFIALGSARNYLHIFAALMDGKPYKRAMNLYSTELFLNRIRQDFGDAAFKLACTSSKAHLHYFNSLGRGRQASLEKLLKRLIEESTSQGADVILFPDEMVEESGYPEGSLKCVSVNAYERNRTARVKCIERWGTQCVVCEFDFGAVYGEIGRGFIHVHHLIELVTRGAAYHVDPVQDLRPVCPNCHSMLHRVRPALSVADLRKRLAEAKSDAR